MEKTKIIVKEESTSIVSSFFIGLFVIFICIFAELFIMSVTRYTSDFGGSIFYIYMFSALLFSKVSSMKDNIKKIIFYSFLIYLILFFIFYAIFSAYDKIKIVDLSNMSHIEKMIIIAYSSLAMYAKSCWVFLIIAITSENLKNYAVKVMTLLVAVIIMLNLGILYFIIFLITIAIIKKFIKNSVIYKTIDLYIFFSIFLLLTEFLIMFNIMTVSFNILTLMGFVKDLTIITDVLERLKSFNFINYILKGNLLEFTDNIYKNDGYSERLSKDSLLYITNQIRDKLSFMFILIICLYKTNNNYIIKSFKYFVIFSIFLFITNFIYFINSNKIEIDIFIRLLYNIFIYYIIYLIISFEIINNTFIRKNIVYILVVFVLYTFNYYFFNLYKINLFNYVIFYFLFKMKDNIDTYKNNKLFIFTLLLSMIIIALTTVLILKESNDFSKAYEISSFFICSIMILFFTKTLECYKKYVIDKINFILIIILKNFKDLHSIKLTNKKKNKHAKNKK